MTERLFLRLPNMRVMDGIRITIFVFVIWREGIAFLCILDVNYKLFDL